MGRLFFKKLLSVVIVVSLVLGQGALSPVMAVSTSRGQKSTTVETIVSTKATMAHCAGMHNKTQPSKSVPAKGMTCAAACAAFSQVILQTMPVASIRYAVVLPFEHADTLAVGHQDRPDLRPPRA